MIGSVLREIRIRSHYHPFVLSGMILVAALILWSGEFNWMFFLSGSLFVMLVLDSHSQIIYLLPRSCEEQKKYCLVRVFLITGFFSLLFLGGVAWNIWVYQRMDVARSSPLIVVLWVLTAILSVVDGCLSVEENQFCGQREKSKAEKLGSLLVCAGEVFSVFMALAINLSDELNVLSICLEGLDSAPGFVVTGFLLAALAADIVRTCLSMKVGDCRE